VVRKFLRFCDLFSIDVTSSTNVSHLGLDLLGLNVLKEDEIWATANDVWHELPSCKIASGFVQAHRIAQKVIDARGGN
jgi:hypothetical protein